jgi:hypothetical protein
MDVNAPLLEKIADESRAKAEFVLPKEDIEVKIGTVFKRLTGPVLADAQLEVLKKDGEPAVGRTRDIMPQKLPDLFEADQLVLLGQYVGEEPITFKISGNYMGKERKFKFTFDFDKADTRNGFVPRLWASRKIAELIDAVRQMGADASVSKNDPKVKELVDEIVRLSTEFGILTEYTAFLAREGTDLADSVEVLREASRSLESRAMRSRDVWLEVAPQVIREFDVAGETAPAAGSTVTVGIFAAGELVKVTGTSKGKGFQGVMKRHGFSGGPGYHGSHFCFLRGRYPRSSIGS